MSFPRLSRKLLRCVNSRIDFPTQRFDSGTQRLQQPGERYVPDGNQVDVTRRALLASSDRTVDEGRFHCIAKRRKPGTYQGGKSSGLGEQALQLRKHGMRGICLETDSGAVGFSQQQSKIDQGL